MYLQALQATAKNSNNTMLCIKKIDTSMLDYYQYNSFDTNIFRHYD